MARVFISVLGTGDYVPCNYQFTKDGKIVHVVHNVRFVQEATVSFSCRDWTENDRILIFTTEASKKKNWENRPQVDLPGDNIEGLAARLDALSLPTLVQNVMIPDGKSEEEIRSIFKTLVDCLTDGDTVVFDITHSFRSIPMLVMVVLNYAKVMKKVSLSGIYYGALEALGTPTEVQRLMPENRNVPVFDLTPFDTLLDWTVAIDRFVSAGDASSVSNLAKSMVTDRLRQSRGSDHDAKVVCTIADNMNAFTKNLSTCRGRSISKCASKLISSIRSGTAILNDIVPAISPLIKSVEQSLANFVGDKIRDGMAAARWCSEHNLIQQGFTILQETLICYLVDQVKEDFGRRENREIATSSIEIFKRKIPEHAWQGAAGTHPAKTRKYIELFDKRPDLASFVTGGIYDRLKDYRNDINHGGYLNNSRKAENFRGVLSETLAEVEKFLGYDAH